MPKKKMWAYQKEALSILKNYNDSEYKQALIKMVNYVIERDK